MLSYIRRVPIPKLLGPNHWSSVKTSIPINKDCPQGFYQAIQKPWHVVQGNYLTFWRFRVHKSSDEKGPFFSSAAAFYHRYVSEHKHIIGLIWSLLSAFPVLARKLSPTTEEISQFFPGESQSLRLSNQSQYRGCWAIYFKEGAMVWEQELPACANV